MKGARIWLAALALASCSGVSALERPQWEFGVAGGTFRSDNQEWSRFYGDDRFSHFTASISYRPWRVVSVGAELGYMADDGQASVPAHGTLAGSVDYRLFPVQLSLTLRGIFAEQQWLVPYAGVAYGRFSYRVDVENQSDATGSASGWTYRAGLQFLLDSVDRRTSRRAERALGLINTYLVLEGRRTDVTVAGVELGGTSYLGGFLFEF